MTDSMDSTIQFMIKNGDKRWYLYELISTLSGGLHELSAYILFDSQNSQERRLFSGAVQLQVNAMHETKRFHTMEEEYLRTGNEQICKKITDVVNKKPGFQAVEHKLTNKMSLLKKQLDNLQHHCSNSAMDGLRSVQETQKQESFILISLEALKQKENDYLEECNSAETFLNDFQSSGLDTLNTLEMACCFKDHLNGAVPRQEMVK